MEATTKTKAERTREILVTYLGQGCPDDKSLIDDLGCDSLDCVEIVMAIEEEFNIEITDADAEELVTVLDCIRYVESRTS